jgi:diaminohydroxyphosphoribosylaminopyrimidine deaminase/5-amino-6-(5-phosphoribosylamino)uracil reductase
MDRALDLARSALGRTSPNPAVGAVVVRDGAIVGEGATRPGGRPHAEVVALAEAGEQAQGATMYVTLEPHCYQARTPPCTQAIIKAGITQVHVGVLDRNPRVAGKGVEELRAAGIGVVVGERASEATEVVEGYHKWVATRLPFVTVKYAMTLDGKIATVAGESRWISGEASRARVHQMRAQSDAIMVGSGTAFRDDPQLTARGADGKPLDRQPLRVVIDSQGRMPVTARMLKEPGKTLVATRRIGPERRGALQAAGAEVVELPSLDGKVDLAALLRYLGEREVTSLLVEGGSGLLGSLLVEGLADKVCAYVAPMLVGGEVAPTPVGGEGIPKLSQAVRLERVRVERVGEDVVITGYIAKES